MRRSLILLALLGLSPIVANGQAADSVALQQLKGRIETETRIRVHVGPQRIVLQNPTLGADGGLSGTGSPTVGFDYVSELQVRRSAWSTGVIVGGAVGAASGLAFGLSTLRDCTNFFDLYCDRSAGNVVFATVVTGAGGALLGGLITAPAKKWKTIYRRSLRDPVRVVVLPARRGSLTLAARVTF